MATKLRPEQVLDVLQTLHPVGSICFSNIATNPASLYGFGTWAVWGAGKTPVDVDPGDTDLDAAEKTYGAKTVTLITGNLPVHLHTVDPPSTASGGQSATHTHSANDRTSTGNSGTGGSKWQNRAGATSGAASATHTHTLDIAQFDSGSYGDGGAHNNIQPSIVSAMWKRTA